MRANKLLGQIGSTIKNITVNMELNNVESFIVRQALKNLIVTMTEELAERKKSGNQSNEGDKELGNVNELYTKVSQFVESQMVPANPLSNFPKSTGF